MVRFLLQAENSYSIDIRLFCTCLKSIPRNDYPHILLQINLSLRRNLIGVSNVQRIRSLNHQLSPDLKGLDALPNNDRYERHEAGASCIWRQSSFHRYLLFPNFPLAHLRSYILLELAI